MQSHSFNDIESAFYNYASNSGVVFSNSTIADGVLHREHVNGDNPGTKNGAYILHADGKPSGWFQHFKTGIVGKWTLSGKQEFINKTMFQQIKKAHQNRQIDEQKRHDNAAIKSLSIWHKAKPIFDNAQHSYLTKKHIQPYQLRLYGNALVVPMYNQNKQIVNLQFITEDGTKRFLSGGQKKSCFSVVGRSISKEIILVCEGWATGASLYESTQYFVVVALDAGNLEPVAIIFRRLYPASQIIICGDNDKSNTGQKAAESAAIAVRGKYIIPPTLGYDFNDMLTLEIAQ
jgi:putative DNA primase/helicase